MALPSLRQMQFMNFRATLDVYVEQHFRFTNVHVRLISSLLRLLQDPSQAATSKDLRASIKVWPYLFRFIVQSRENQKVSASCQIGAGAVNEHLEASFKHDLRQVLTGINRLMSTTKPSAIIGTQTLALQHFAGSYPDLLRVFSLDEMVQIATSFTDAAFITKGKMATWKLLHILQLVSGVLFEHPVSRAALIPAVGRWVRPHLGTFEPPPPPGPDSEQSQSASDGARVTWLESASLAVSVLAVILDRLYVQIASLRAQPQPLNGTPSPSRSHSYSTSGSSTSVELRQELDNIDYLLSSLPPLLQTYQEFASAETAKTLERHRTPSTVPSSTPILFPSSYPFALVARLPIAQHVPSSARNLHRQYSTSITSALELGDADSAAQQQPYLNCGLGAIAAVMNVLLVLSPTRDLSQFLEERLDVSGLPAVTGFIKDYCAVAHSLLSRQAFPSSWLNFAVLTHQMILKTLGPLSDLLLARFVPQPPSGRPEDFDTSLWSSVLSLLMRLLASPLVAPEQFSSQRRRVLINLTGDLRALGGTLLARMWNALGAPSSGLAEEASSTPTPGDVPTYGPRPREKATKEATEEAALATGGYQVQFIPSLVEPVLQLCLSSHDVLRTCAVRILATMITSQWHFEGSFSVIEAEIIDKLDAVFLSLSPSSSPTHGASLPAASGAGLRSLPMATVEENMHIEEAIYNYALFLPELQALFDGPEVDSRLRAAVQKFLASVSDFVSLLVSVRTLPPEAGFEDDRISGTLQLLGFLRAAKRSSVFSTHVLRLVNLHLSHEAWSEAALTLKLYADQLDWSVSRIAPAAPELGLPSQTYFVRKEALYLLMLDYLNRDQAWETARDVCRELAWQYECTSCNYHRLSGLLAYQANLYTRMATVERPFPSYFLVGFDGTAWPRSIQGNHFVYRGHPWETPEAFVDRMQQLHPYATVIEPPDPLRFLPDAEDERILLISPLTPEPDRSKSMFTSPDAPPLARAYSEHSGINTFSFVRPIHPHVSDTDSINRSESSQGGGSTPKLESKLRPKPGLKLDLKHDEEQGLTQGWVEKTYVQCEDVFPTVLRRSLVIEHETAIVSPLENALLVLDRKTAELETLEKKYEAAKSPYSLSAGDAGFAPNINTGKINTNRLSMAINGLVDAPSEGGIAYVLIGVSQSLKLIHVGGSTQFLVF